MLRHPPTAGPSTAGTDEAPMRIIAGTLKGRHLRMSRGRAIRPTADRVREALFSILTSRFELTGAIVLDLFAGTGAVGIEAISRGAAQAVFVEQGRPALQVLRLNLTDCGCAARSLVLPLPAHRALRELAVQGRKFDGVFADPPYGRGLAQRTLRELAVSGILHEGAWVMIEVEAESRLPESCGQLHLTQTRRYGNTCLALYETAGRNEQAVEL